MPNINIGPEDWQNVAMSYANENINLKAQLQALARTINEMEQDTKGAPGTSGVEVKSEATKAAK